MKARQHFYRLGQKAAAWRLGMGHGFRLLCGMPTGRAPDWAVHAFDAGYMDQAGFWARR